MLGRDYDGLRFGAGKRDHCVRTDRKREVGRPLGLRGVHDAVNVDCAITVEPAGKRFSDILGPHEF